MTPPRPLDPQPLERALAECLGVAALAWLDQARARLHDDPGAIATIFPAVGRAVGRGPLRAGWTVDAAARTLLLVALGPAASSELAALYHHGDAAERCGVLQALAYLPIEDSIGLPLLHDALRTNDLRLIAAALGPYALVRLDDDALCQAVLKCVFVEVPLNGIVGLQDRVTAEMAAMLARYAHERIAAGRNVPPEIWPLVDCFPPAVEISAIEAELRHPQPQRREAAAKALADRAEAASHTTTASHLPPAARATAGRPRS